MNPIQVYHYTNEKAWEAMNHGRHGYVMFDPRTNESVLSTQTRGLWPREKLVKFSEARLSAEAYKSVAHALLESEPDSWVRNRKSPYMWQRLMSDVISHAILSDGKKNQIVLVKANVLPEDEAFVVDWGHVEYVDSDDKTGSQQAFERYSKSAVKLHEYTVRSYEIPEVVIFNPVPPERLEVVWKKTIGETQKHFQFVGIL